MQHDVTPASNCAACAKTRCPPTRTNSPPPPVAGNSTPKRTAPRDTTARPDARRRSPNPWPPTAPPGVARNTRLFARWRIDSLRARRLAAHDVQADRRSSRACSARSADIGSIRSRALRRFRRQKIDRRLRQADGQRRRFVTARARAHAARHHVRDRPGDQPVVRNFDAVQMHGPGRAGRDADQRQRIGDLTRPANRSAPPSSSCRSVASPRFDERRGHHDHVGRRAARHPRRHAIEPKPAGNRLRRQHGLRQMPPARREMRNADRGEQLPARQPRQQPLLRALRSRNPQSAGTRRSAA